VPFEVQTYTTDFLRRGIKYDQLTEEQRKQVEEDGEDPTLLNYEIRDLDKNVYKKDTGRRFADRDDFADAIDFVGWYTHTTSRSVGISKWDPYNQYLAYHEGATGWKRGTYKRKGWLKDTARRVDYRAREWGAQLKRCEHDLDKGWWIFG